MGLDVQIRQATSLPIMAIYMPRSFQISSESRSRILAAFPREKEFGYRCHYQNSAMGAECGETV
jgi:hypothetical protein